MVLKPPIHFKERSRMCRDDFQSFDQIPLNLSELADGDQRNLVKGMISNSGGCPVFQGTDRCVFRSVRNGEAGRPAPLTRLASGLSAQA